MKALAMSYPIDRLPSKKINMSALAEKIKNAENIDGLMPIDINSPEHLKHYFANGAYVREMILPANTVVVGRIHKHETINILLEGEITVIDENGSRTDFKAPNVFIAPAGNQKAAKTLTPIRWLNCWACETTDPDEALDLLTCETAEEYSKFIDSEDVKRLTIELGMSDEQMKGLVNTSDVIPDRQRGVYISESEINGIGIFSKFGFEMGHFIADMRMDLNRTLVGRYTNHSLTPNSKPEFIDGVLSLVSVKDIAQDEEITCNYREVLKVRHEQGDL
jgi:hypothetical protein